MSDTHTGTYTLKPRIYTEEEMKNMRNGALVGSAIAPAMAYAAGVPSIAKNMAEMDEMRHARNAFRDTIYKDKDVLFAERKSAGGFNKTPGASGGSYHVPKPSSRAYLKGAARKFPFGALPVAALMGAMGGGLVGSIVNMTNDTKRAASMASKTASEQIYDIMEKEAGLSQVGKYFGDVSGRNLKSAKKAVAAAKGSAAPAGPDWIGQMGTVNARAASALADRNSARKGTALVLGGAGATGAGVAYKQKRSKSATNQGVVEKAAELLVDAVICKEACYQNAESAELYAEASELALNSLGYSL